LGPLAIRIFGPRVSLKFPIWNLSESGFLVFGGGRNSRFEPSRNQDFWFRGEAEISDFGPPGMGIFCFEGRQKTHTLGKRICGDIIGLEALIRKEKDAY
jgi:hypothetical protein